MFEHFHCFPMFSNVRELPLFSRQEKINSWKCSSIYNCGFFHVSSHWPVVRLIMRTARNMNKKKKMSGNWKIFIFQPLEKLPRRMNICWWWIYNLLSNPIKVNFVFHLSRSTWSKTNWNIFFVKSPLYQFFWMQKTFLNVENFSECGQPFWEHF